MHSHISVEIIKDEFKNINNRGKNHAFSYICRNN